MIQKQNWIELASVQIGGAICLPMIVIGFELAKCSLQTAIVALLCGNFCLFIMALIYARISSLSQKSTVENAETYFGAYGKKAFSVILLLSMSCWFSLQSEVLAEEIVAASSLYFPYAKTCVAIALSCAIGVLCVKGIGIIADVSHASVCFMGPTLIIALMYAYFSGDGSFVEANQAALSCSEAVSVVIGACILAVIDLPTFFRHAKSAQEAKKAVVATFLLGIPMIECVGMLLARYSGELTVTGALSMMPSIIWKGWVFVFVMIAGLTTNNVNLYSAANALQALIFRSSEKKAMGVAVLLCCLMSLLQVAAHLAFVLELFAVIMASMGTVVCVAYIKGKMMRTSNFFSWLVGLMCGICALMGVSITSIAIVDAAFASCLSSLIFITKEYVVHGYYNR